MSEWVMNGYNWWGAICGVTVELCNYFEVIKKHNPGYSYNQGYDPFRGRADLLWVVRASRGNCIDTTLHQVYFPAVMAGLVTGVIPTRHNPAILLPWGTS